MWYPLVFSIMEKEQYAKDCAQYMMPLRTYIYNYYLQYIKVQIVFLHVTVLNFGCISQLNCA